ncbi:MAG: hypothetical protein Q9208_002642 [Pyrenodesmia sp. 3 TL-2023]
MTPTHIPFITSQTDNRKFQDPEATYEGVRYRLPANEALFREMVDLSEDGGDDWSRGDAELLERMKDESGSIEQEGWYSKLAALDN